MATAQTVSPRQFSCQSQSQIFKVYLISIRIIDTDYLSS